LQAATTSVAQLSTGTAYEQPHAGTDQIFVSGAAGTWTLNAVTGSWIHVSPTSATIPGLLQFSFDGNDGPPRTGTITLNAGGTSLTLTITQFDNNVEVQNPVNTIAASGFQYPDSVAVDVVGNVFIADTGNGLIKEWNQKTQQITTVVSGLTQPYGVAVDGSGNIFISDNGSLKEWSAGNQQITTLISGLAWSEGGVAVDQAGNAYIADSGRIWRWSGGQPSIFLSLPPGVSPQQIAIDPVGDFYVADVAQFGIWEWSAASKQWTEITSSGLTAPWGVAVDAFGNVLIADTGNNAIKMWDPQNGHIITLGSTGFNMPRALAVDANRNVYIADSSNQAIEQLAFAYLENDAPNLAASVTDSGNGFWLPGDQSRTFTVTVTNNSNFSTQSIGINLTLSSGLTITGMPSGAGWTCSTETLCIDHNLLLAGVSTTLTVKASISATASSPQSLTAAISWQANAVTSATETIKEGSLVLGTPVLVEGPNGGPDTIVVGTNPIGAKLSWTASTSGSWLHVPGTSETGATFFRFEVDPNWGGARTGTISFTSPGLAPVVLTVIQSPAGYVWQATSAQQLVYSQASYSSFPWGGVAVDPAGANVYYGNTTPYVWTPAKGAVPLDPADTNDRFYAFGLDPEGNVYWDDGNIVRWDPQHQTSTKIFQFGPETDAVSMATDPMGDVFFSVYELNSYGEVQSGQVYEWNSVTGTTTPLGITLGFNIDNSFDVVAADAAGNVYVGGDGDTAPAVQRWNTLTQKSTLTLSGPPAAGIAVDGRGNIYMGESGGPVGNYLSGPLQMWSSTTEQISTLENAGTHYFGQVAVDEFGNIYFAETGTGYINKVSVGWVPSNVFEPATAGSDAFTIYPGQNIIGTAWSDQTWLTVTSASNGVVSFTFAANTGNSRQGHISYGTFTVTVTQGAAANHAGISVAVTDSGSSTLEVNSQATLSVMVANNGGSATAAPVTVNLSIPGGLIGGTLSGNGWTCSSATTCTSAGTVAAGTSLPALTIPVTVAPTALTPVIVTATVSSTGVQSVSASDVILVLGASLSASTATEGPASGSDQVMVNLPSQPSLSWTTSTSAAWLHTTASGTGSGTLQFSFDANTSNTARTGTIVITFAGGSNTLTVFQAGAKWSSPQAGVWVNAGPIFEPASGGTDSPVMVVPPTTPSAPKSETEWLSITTASPISYAVDPNISGGPRTDYIDVLGTRVQVIQAGQASMWEPGAAGKDTFIPQSLPADTTWTVTASDTWLHPAVTSGQGSTLFAFSYDANPGSASRIASIVFTFSNGFNGGSLTLTVNQAPAGYQAAYATSDLYPGAKISGVAVDNAQNVYLDDPYVPVMELNAKTQTISKLPGISNGLPYAIAVDPAANVYAAWLVSGINEWVRATGGFSSYIAPDVTYSDPPGALGTDTSGKLYWAPGFLGFAGSPSGVVYLWDPATRQNNMIISGLSVATGVAVDGTGTVVVADNGNNAVKEWSPVTQQVTTIASATSPGSVAVDLSGNVYFTDQYYFSQAYGGPATLWKWSAATQQITALGSGYMVDPTSNGLTVGITVDAAGSVYVAGSDLYQLKPAFVPTTPVVEAATAGNDSLPPVIPASAPLGTPTSDQSWLTITGTANGVVSFSFEANTG
ncbi:MAG: hypothetical protein JO022_17830, partial [Acidobacteriaceae bacterium]|nr:hypothetical protein [Acidobacteriaceae bacterium]